MNLKPISNNVIAKVEDMIKDRYTYKQIKEVTGVSDGTIAKVKQGKITSNRKIENWTIIEKYIELKERLLHKEKEISDLNKRIEELKVYEQIYLERLE